MTISITIDRVINDLSLRRESSSKLKKSKIQIVSTMFLISVSWYKVRYIESVGSCVFHVLTSESLWLPSNSR
jgi:hypothetical protein